MNNKHHKIEDFIIAYAFAKAGKSRKELEFYLQHGNNGAYVAKDASQAITNVLEKLKKANNG